MGKKRKSGLSQPGRVTLREVAEHVDLAAGTVSAVLNKAPSARAVSERTRQRVKGGAPGLDYRPQFFGRSFRKKRTSTAGVFIEEIWGAYAAPIFCGI